MKYRISIVSYLNTIPFIYGLKQSNLLDKIDLQLDYPSNCADKLLRGKVDIGLVPVVVLKKMNTPNIISDFCIGSDGVVDTVCLYSEVPINEIKSIYLDYQSKTSIELLKILLKKYWYVSPVLFQGKEGFEQMINRDNAALVIGDRAFNLNNKYKYSYDLSQTWKLMTGLPFVFAIWVASKELPRVFISEFNLALKNGLSNIDQAIESEAKNYNFFEDSKDYLNNKISYSLDSEKREGMNLFLNEIIT